MAMNMWEFKVLLIHANSTLDTLIPPNLSIISAVLKQAGITVKLFDTTFYKTRAFTGDDARVRTLQVKETNFEDLGITLNTTDMYDDFIKMVKEYNPDLIGLSAVELTYSFGLKLLKRLRFENIRTPTIVGGIHATLSSEEVLNEKCVDYVCIAEGEFALKELCEALRDNKDDSNIMNIWVKKNGSIIKNPIRPPVSLEDLPFQDWDIFDKRRLYKPMGGKIRKTGCFELNRGCPYSCTYCCNEFFHKMYNYKHYRERSVRKFIDEVKLMKEKYGLEYIYVSAESFLSTNEVRFGEFIKLWKEEINLPFWVETRPESVTEERVKLLEQAGCASISVGVESGSPEIRKTLNRHMTNQQVIDAFKALKKTNLRVGANSILGFPGETREQVFETIELNRQINVDNCMIHVFNPYRGTKLFDICVEKGYISKDTLGGDYRADAMLEMPQLSKEEIMGLQRTFSLYVKFPKERWPEIKIAERFDEVGNMKFEELKKEFTEKYFSDIPKLNTTLNLKRNILLNPGPATTSDSVKMAQVVPDICPREKEFGELISFVRSHLLKVVNANPEHYSCVLFGGSGTLGVEAVISSVVPLSGKLLIINNGSYGQRQKEIAEVYSIPFYDWKIDSRELPNLDELAKLIDSEKFTHLSFVHHETTTGLLNPFEQIVSLAKSRGLDVIADTVSSYAGVPIDLSAVPADFIVSTSNKCIQGMAGITFVIGRKDKIEQSKFIKRALYVNLYEQYLYMDKQNQFRFTPPVQTLYALKQAIIEFFKEGGIENRYARYSKNWEVLIKGLEKLNLQWLLPKWFQSKILVSVDYPNSPYFDFNKLHDRLYEKGFTIYPGKIGEYNTFRISTLGDISSKDISNFLSELEKVLSEMNVLQTMKFDWKTVWEHKGSIVTENVKELDGFESANINPLDFASRITSALDIKPNDKVLEVGCGAGMIAQHLSCKYVGVDYSKHLIDKHKMILGNEVYVAEACKLPFPDKSFDKVFCFSIFQYFPNKEYAQMAISEMKRVSKGLVFIGDLPETSHSKDHLCYSRSEFNGIISEGYYNPVRFNVLINGEK
ncbi:MAG: 2-aminoethylphosphonate--pyruvate transaminase [Candidatus Woesearchaeota archaeon]